MHLVPVSLDELLLGFLALIGLVLQVRAYFVLLLVHLLCLEHHEGPAYLHARRRSWRNLNRSLSQGKCAELCSLILQPKLALLVLYQAMVPRHADVADFDVAVWTSSYREAPSESREALLLRMQDVHHALRFHLERERLQHQAVAVWSWKVYQRVASVIVLEDVRQR